MQIDRTLQKSLVQEVKNIGSELSQMRKSNEGDGAESPYWPDRQGDRADSIKGSEKEKQWRQIYNKQGNVLYF